MAKASIHDVARSQMRSNSLRRLWNNKYLYVMLIPVLANFIIFHYLPFMDITIAFKQYNLVLGASRSPWVGWRNFESFFGSYYFWDVLKNTLTISISSIVLGFPMPILLALLLNESPSRKYKTVVQSCSYLPYFVSVVVCVGMFKMFLGVDDGIINDMIASLGLRRQAFLTTPAWFLFVYMLIIIWRWTGYDAIVYLASMTSIDPMLYEAAQIDGAGRLGRIWHVTLPGIRTTIVLLLIMRLGGIMSLQWQDILLLQNDLNLSVSEVIQTFVYKRGMLKADYSYATAVGLFQSVVGFVFVVAANAISKRLSDTSLF